jgi:hypothetical protein
LIVFFFLTLVFLGLFICVNLLGHSLLNLRLSFYSSSPTFFFFFVLFAFFLLVRSRAIDVVDPDFEYSPPDPDPDPARLIYRYH